MADAPCTLAVCARHRVGSLALDVSFDVPPGVTVLFGPSGAGKTTALRIIAGLERAAEATVRLGDVPWTDSKARVHLPPEARGVSLFFQALALFPHLCALDNVAFGARDEADAARWLERFHVAHVAARKPPTLSGGEAQRVALARALAARPKVLLLDEPFSSLDDALRDELAKELKAVIAEARVPTLLVTHDRHEARLLGERVVLLSAGRVAARGGLELLGSPS
ncbi:MAG: ATP-binding cassette domain-containing protein [Myxococcales bacterium]|nr:ATP-binding cassette domain-containing protein [Myxococcales bacterium]